MNLWSTCLDHHLADRGLSFDYVWDQLVEEVNIPWVKKPHIIVVAVSTKGICGQPNEACHDDCIVCGRSFVSIKKDVTLEYIVSTHKQGESHKERMGRKHAFQAGMKAGQFILNHTRVSQASACNGNYYQFAPDNDTSAPSLEMLTV